MLIAEMNGGWIGILQELELRKWFHHKSHVVYFRVAEMIISFSLIPCSIYLFLLLFYSFQFYFLIFIKHLTISYVIISRLLIFFFFFILQQISPLLFHPIFRSSLIWMCRDNSQDERMLWNNLIKKEINKDFWQAAIPRS